MLLDVPKNEVPRKRRGPKKKKTVVHQPSVTETLVKIPAGKTFEDFDEQDSKMSRTNDYRKSMKRLQYMLPILFPTKSGIVWRISKASINVEHKTSNHKEWRGGMSEIQQGRDDSSGIGIYLALKEKPKEELLVKIFFVEDEKRASVPRDSATSQINGVDQMYVYWQAIHQYFIALSYSKKALNEPRQFMAARYDSIPKKYYHGAAKSSSNREDRENAIYAVAAGTKRLWASLRNGYEPLQERIKHLITSHYKSNHEHTQRQIT